MTDVSMGKLAEIDASGFFENESVNWRRCTRFATFEHRDACEFVVHIGDADDDLDYAKSKVEQMRRFGCTANFIAAYQAAAAAGAVRVIFFV